MSESERFERNPTDTVEATDELYWSNPKLWVQTAIGVETNRIASEVSDHELADRYNDGGFAEWDPRIAQAVRDHLTSIGFIDLRS
jgi:hypothetical protein